MAALTAQGVECDGRQIVDIVETERGARLDAAAHLGSVELRHVAKITSEMAVNAEQRSRERDLPAVVSPAGC